ncbi:MAG: methionine--tRNA ligase [Patescibacteria group bacterium]|nr:methionine--tRNA ligase [Patescibacteria group bacterium]
MKPFYITTTLPYVNADPHVGFAVELIRADAIARAQALIGREVFFNTGTDEHGAKLEKAAKAMDLSPQKYVDEKSQKFRELLPILGIDETAGITRNFIRTTDTHHIAAAQEFWKIVDKNGWIYKKNYSVKYCVGCELEKTESELVDGRCPLHPNQEIEIIQEENYFFKFSAFQKRLLDLYDGVGEFAGKPLRIVPENRKNEIRSFVSRGLEDFSISRLSSKMSWGIPVPGDSTQVMYVWFDALVDYISAIGWPEEKEEKIEGETESEATLRGEGDLRARRRSYEEFSSKKISVLPNSLKSRSFETSFKKWWIDSGGVVQYCGKDNLRQQAAMWQAMLLAANLPPSQTIVIDGFVTGDGGIKMSKSLGNTIDPFSVVSEYGTEALRYYALAELHPFEDSPFTMEKFKSAYNAALANGIGNLTSRIMKMATANGISFDKKTAKEFAASNEMEDLYKKQTTGFENYNLQEAAQAVWSLIAGTDKIIQEREPFKKIKTDKIAAEKDIKELLIRLDMISTMLQPLLPETAKKIAACIKENKMPETPLFMRK